MTPLSKDQIIAADDLPTLDVDVPEWGGTVRVRAMTGSERERFADLSRKGVAGESAETESATDAGFQALFVSFCAVDESGTLAFPTDADRRALGRKNAKVLGRVFLAAWKLNAMGQSAAEELEKNSGATPTARTGSSSPSTSGG